LLIFCTIPKPWPNRHSDGKVFFRDHPDAKAKPQVILFSVKGGNLKLDDVRALDSVVKAAFWTAAVPCRFVAGGGAVVGFGVGITASRPACPVAPLLPKAPEDWRSPRASPLSPLQEKCPRSHERGYDISRTALFSPRFRTAWSADRIGMEFGMETP